MMARLPIEKLPRAPSPAARFVRRFALDFFVIATGVFLVALIVLGVVKLAVALFRP